MSLNDGVPRVHQFKLSLEPKRFKFTGDEFVFEAAPDLPPTVLDLVPLLTKIDVSAGQEGIQPLYDFMEEVLLPDSVTEFRERLSSKNKTFGITSIRETITWLLEEYGLRPTQPSLPSPSASLGDDGTSSTAGA